MPLMNIFLALLLAPLFPGIINKIKAFFAGRKGPPVLQLYFDLCKLGKKRDIYSKTTTGVLKLNAIVCLLAMLLFLFFVPFANHNAYLSFSGDIIFLAYLLGLIRFFMVLASWDTGSSFEEMGASREVAFAVFVEPALFLTFASLVKKTGQMSLSNIYTTLDMQPWLTTADFSLLIIIVLLIILLVENCRMPIDDPNTHLELTMIHEVMILDYSSSDLASILYGSSIKLWVYSALLVGLVLPPATVWWLNEVYFLSGMGIVAVIIGVIESIMARLSFAQVFALVLVAFVIASFTFLLI